MCGVSGTRVIDSGVKSKLRSVEKQCTNSLMQVFVISNNAPMIECLLKSATFAS